jgi:hypothetical protein
VFTFTQQHIIPDSFEITYTPLADRKPFCATVLWRQQDDLGIPVMRTAEVRYTGTAVDGPYEQHDLSGFCSTENHAVKVGAYILSKRRHVTHRLQLGVKPDAYNPTLAAGDLVRVRLERVASTGASSVHDYLYEVDRIGKSITGEVQLDLTHFPVDSNLASVVAQEVNAATGSGLLLPTGLSGITCDVNSSTDTSVPAETFTDETFSDYGNNIGELDESGLGDPPIDNPEDGIGGQSTPEAEASVGDVLTAPDCNCANSSIQWYRGTVAFGDLPIAGATANIYTVGVVDGGAGVYAVITCTDGSGVCVGKPTKVEKMPLNVLNDLGSMRTFNFSATATIRFVQAPCDPDLAASPDCPPETVFTYTTPVSTVTAQYIFVEEQNLTSPFWVCSGGLGHNSVWRFEFYNNLGGGVSSGQWSTPFVYSNSRCRGQVTVAWSSIEINFI